jgi:hypothetical protein
MNVRFQADADLNQTIVSGVLRRQPEVDFQTAAAAGLEGVSDLEVLAIAVQEGRILVTHDRKTMPSAFGEFVMTQTSAGVLIVSQSLPISAAIDALILVWRTADAETWQNQIASIPFKA